MTEQLQIKRAGTGSFRGRDGVINLDFPQTSSPAPLVSLLYPPNPPTKLGSGYEIQQAKAMAEAPFTFRHGRRYLRDSSLTYPLPVDITELHRQHLRTLLLISLFGGPFASPAFTDAPPKRVLEIACGAALWSSTCDEYFKSRGWENVSFTGLDITPLAPDLKQQGTNWRFIQHDLRRPSLPFEDEEFDFIFVKDTAMCSPVGGSERNPLGEYKRYLRPGGVIEVWESDLILRCLLPLPLVAPGASDDKPVHAEATTTYTTTSRTEFVKAQNRNFVDYNTWVKKGLRKLRIPSNPCELMDMAFCERKSYTDRGRLRMAIPFGELRWEAEDPPIPEKGEETKSQTRGNRTSKSSEPSKAHSPLNPDQMALRQTALQTVIGLIESLEPMLMKESEMKQDEWDRWWAGMTSDLLEKNGAADGECLEVGAWWARKR